MGVGMALFEETRYDAQTAAPLNRNFADYVVASNADHPAMDVTFLDYPDYNLNELGARGVGEIGLAGVAHAITVGGLSRDRRARPRPSGQHRGSYRVNTITMGRTTIIKSVASRNVEAACASYTL